MSLYDALKGAAAGLALYTAAQMSYQHSLGHQSYQPQISAPASYAVSPARNTDWGSLSPQKVYGVRDSISMDYDSNRMRTMNQHGFTNMGPYMPLSELLKNPQMNLESTHRYASANAAVRAPAPRGAMGGCGAKGK